MSWACKVRKINHIKPHPNADKIEIGFIGNWPVIIPKGQYQIGQLVSYFPVDSVIPENWLQEWGLSGKLSGSARNRVKAIRLRGELSVGIVCPAPEGFAEGDDIANYYGVTQYEEPIPVCLSGKVLSRPRTFMKFDVENYNNEPDWFETGELVSISRKLHGTNSSFGLVDDTFYVCSRNYGLVKDDTNLYWRMALKYDVENVLRDMFKSCGTNWGLWLHGEIIGRGINDFTYGLNDSELRIFDIRYATEAGDEFAEYSDLLEMLNTLPVVKEVYRGPFDPSMLEQLASGMDESGFNINEGVVIRPINGRQFNNKGQRRIQKFINPEYLLRKGGKENH